MRVLLPRRRLLPVLIPGAPPLAAHWAYLIEPLALTPGVPREYGGRTQRQMVVETLAGRREDVVEDAAQAIGAVYKGRPAGSIGSFGCFSFFPSKNLGAYGDAGMMVTQDDALAERLRRLRLHGGSKEYFHDEVGFNSRLDTLQAAVLLTKLAHLAEWSAARARHAARYTKAFTGHPEVCPPRTDPANEHIFNQYTLRVPRRDALQAHLKAKHIGNSIYYPLSLHLQPCFAHLGYAKGSLPVSEAASAQVISLPVFPELTEAQQQTVIDAVLGFYS